MEQLERTDPAKHAELVELRRVSPQAFRKELARLIKKGVIVKGRTYRLRDEDVDLLGSYDIRAILKAVDEQIEQGEYDFRRVGGLIQEEKMGRARPDLMAALKERFDALLDAEGRHIP
jgi:hypothetical protein